MEYIRSYYAILFYLLNKLTTFLIPEQHELLKRKEVRDQPQQINIFPDIQFFKSWQYPAKVCILNFSTPNISLVHDLYLFIYLFIVYNTTITLITLNYDSDSLTYNQKIFNAPVKMNTHGSLNFQSILYSQNKATLNRVTI